MTLRCTSDLGADDTASALPRNGGGARRRGFDPCVWPIPIREPPLSNRTQIRQTGVQTGSRGISFNIFNVFFLNLTLEWITSFLFSNFPPLSFVTLLNSFDPPLKEDFFLPSSLCFLFHLWFQIEYYRIRKISFEEKACGQRVVRQKYKRERGQSRNSEW